MRAFLTILVGFFVALITFGLLAGPVIDPIVEIVVGFDVIQEQGYEDTVFSTQRVILRYGPLLILGGLVFGAVRWAIRKERVTGVRR